MKVAAWNVIRYLPDVNHYLNLNN